MTRRPLAVAITGGIGAGKSAALEAFARRGVPTRSSDAIVHDLLAGDAEVRAAVVGRWGERALGADGALDRTRIAEVVFANRAELDWLERLLHPRVVAEVATWRDDLGRRAEPPPVCAVEVPLLYETGGEERFDAVVVVTAPPDLRAARARVRPDEREIRLVSDDEKVRRADYAYVNTGSLEDLEAWVGGVLAELRERA